MMREGRPSGRPFFFVARSASGRSRFRPSLPRTWDLIATGRVIGGKAVVEDLALEEPARVTVLAREREATFDLTPKAVLSPKPTGVIPCPRKKSCRALPDESIYSLCGTRAAALVRIFELVRQLHGLTRESNLRAHGLDFVDYGIRCPR